MPNIILKIVYTIIRDVFLSPFPPSQRRSKHCSKCHTQRRAQFPHLPISLPSFLVLSLLALSMTFVWSSAQATTTQKTTQDTQTTQNTAKAVQTHVPQVRWRQDLKVMSSIKVTTQGDLIFMTKDRKLQRTNAEGRKLWSFPLGDIGRAQPLLTPEKDILVVSYDDHIYKISGDGQLIWKTKLDGDLYATPALRPDGSIVVSTAGGSVYTLNKQGKILWRYRVGAAVFSSPALANDGTIYFGGHNNHLHALTPNGKLKWKFKAGSLIFSSPALDAVGNVYFGSSDRFIYSVSPKGKLRWRKETGRFVNASPIVTSRGLVVIGSYDGNVYGLTTEGRGIWTYQIGAFVTAPAIELNDGTLLVGDLQGGLHALSSEGMGLWVLNTGRKIDTSVALSTNGKGYFSNESGLLFQLQGLAPVASGPWTTFRGTVDGWGRGGTKATPTTPSYLAQQRPAQQNTTLTPAKTSTNANKTSTPAQPADTSRPVMVSPAPLPKEALPKETPPKEPTKKPEPTPPHKPKEQEPKEQAATTKTEEPRTANQPNQAGQPSQKRPSLQTWEGKAHVLLSDLVGNSGFKLQTTTPKWAAVLSKEQELYMLRIRHKHGVPYIALKEWARLPKVAISWRSKTQLITIEHQERKVKYLIDLLKLWDTNKSYDHRI